MKLRRLARAGWGLIRPQPHSRGAIERYQLACIRDLARHAYGRVPYYRRLLDRAGVHPDRIRSLSDLSSIPITSRADIQLLPASDVCASDVKIESLRVRNTSGSTGSPLTVRRATNEERALLAFRLKARRSLGLGIRTRRARIDHFERDTMPGQSARKLHERFGILAQLNIDWRRPKDEIVEALERFQPYALSGPPSILAWFADTLADADRRRLRIQLLTTGGEQLTAGMKRQIDERFGLPLVETYGSHETVFIAVKFPGRQAFRICEEAVMLEVLDGDKPALPGESGEVVVTALHSFAMPFIRYRLGDQVIAGDLEGHYKTIRSIEGRTIDRFFLPSGRVLHGYTLGEAVEASGLPVRRFQITQERRDEFRVSLVLQSNSSGSLEGLESALLDRLEPGVDVRIDVVDSVERVDGRKFYPFVSLERLEAWRSANRRS